MNDWYENHDDVVEFGRILFEAGNLDTVSNTLDYMERPWRWDLEHKAWSDLLRPELGDTSWDKFLTALGDLA